MNCDFLAPWYRLLETVAFGKSLEQARVALLPWAFTGTLDPPVRERALLLGEGDGRFLSVLRQLQPTLTVDCVELSQGMLELARAREASIPGGPEVRFHHREAQAWLQERADEIEAGTAHRFDLVVTNFFLDCFTDRELPGLCEAVGRVCAPSARWLVADFRQPPGRGFLAWRASVWLRVMYIFFRWTTGLRTRNLADFRPHVRANGFRRERVILSRGGLLTAEGWRR